MNYYHKVFLAVFLSVFYACEDTGTPGAPISLEGDEEMASYGFGREIGNSMFVMNNHLELDKLFRGIEDALNEIDTPVPMAELSQAGQRIVQRAEEEERTRMEEAGVENAKAGESFLVANAVAEGVRVTDSGLQYEILEETETTGPKPESTSQVRVHYRGTLIDGTEFDSSYSRGEPATFGVGGVIPGFGEGLQLMSVGSKYRFFIPSDLAYGATGAGGAIGPNSTLIFELELLEIL